MTFILMLNVLTLALPALFRRQPEAVGPLVTLGIITLGVDATALLCIAMNG